MHSVHHRQHNPCRWDSSYIHPIEVAIGLGLYVATIFVLSRFMGNFHVATVIITWLAFTEINLHNHDLWKEDKFPFRHLNYMAQCTTTTTPPSAAEISQRFRCSMTACSGHWTRAAG